MAQLGSALEWGSRGRKFKSSHPDQIDKKRPKFVRKSVFFITLFSLWFYNFISLSAIARFNINFAFYIVDRLLVKASNSPGLNPVSRRIKATIYMSFIKAVAPFSVALLCSSFNNSINHF